MQKLPSVGPKAGHSIITYRNLNGSFHDLETLKLVPGLRKNFHANFLKVRLINQLHVIYYKFDSFMQVNFLEWLL